MSNIFIHHWDDNNINEYLSAYRDLQQLEKNNAQYSYQKKGVESLRERIKLDDYSDDVALRNIYMLNRIEFIIGHLKDIISIEIEEDDLPKAWGFNIHSYIAQRIRMEINEDSILFRFKNLNNVGKVESPRQAVEIESHNFDLNLDEKNLLNYLNAKREYLIHAAPSNFIELEDFLREFIEQLEDLEKAVRAGAEINA